MKKILVRCLRGENEGNSAWGSTESWEPLMLLPQRAISSGVRWEGACLAQEVQNSLPEVTAGQAGGMKGLQVSWAKDNLSALSKHHL